MALLKEGCRARNLACIIYAEGISFGQLVPLLDGMHVPCALSPLHDSDLYDSTDVKKWVQRKQDEWAKLPATEQASGFEAWLAGQPNRVVVGQPKKAHWHCVFQFKGGKTGEQIAALFAPDYELNPRAIEVVEHLDSYTRYLAHMDSKDLVRKPRYNWESVIGFGGFDLSALAKTPDIDRMRTIAEIHEHMQKRKWRYFYQLADDALASGDPEYMAGVIGRAGFWGAYFNSHKDARQERKRQEEDASTKGQTEGRQVS